MSRGVGYSEPILNPSKTNRNPPRINLNLFTLIHLSPSVLNRLSSYAANARSARASYPEPPFMWKFYKNIGRCVSLLFLTQKFPPPTPLQQYVCNGMMIDLIM